MSQKDQISLILDRIKEEKDYSGYGSDKLLAQFLGIEATKLANWRTRGGMNYEKVIEKCDTLDCTYIFTGRRPEQFSLPDILLAVSAVEKACISKNINDVTEIKPKIVVLALKKKKELDKSWDEIQEIIDTAIELAVESMGNR